MHPALKSLPQFELLRVDQGSGTLLYGHFTQLTQFHRENMDHLNYLYSGNVSYVGNTLDYNGSSETAVFHTPDPISDLIRVGHTFTWLYGYYQPRDIDIILSPIHAWHCKNYPDQVDHDHCIICGKHICGKQNCPDYASGVAYYHADGEWLCTSCFTTYVEANDFVFLR